MVGNQLLWTVLFVICLACAHHGLYNFYFQKNNLVLKRKGSFPLDFCILINFVFLTYSKSFLSPFFITAVTNAAMLYSMTEYRIYVLAIY